VGPPLPPYSLPVTCLCSYNKHFVDLSNKMDEVWVPSKFSKDTLIASGICLWIRKPCLETNKSIPNHPLYLWPGVKASKVRIVPIAVNTTLYDPNKTMAFELPKGQLIFGRHRRAITAVSVTEDGIICSDVHKGVRL